MKAFLALLVMLGGPLTGFSPVVHAADISDNDLDIDFDPSAEESSGAQQNQNSAPSDTSIRSATRQNRSIYIVNQATSGAKNQTETDTKASNNTNTKASNVSASDSSEASLIEVRAEQARRHRQRAERDTEAMANAKIEESRLRDEERRHEALFGDRLKDNATEINKGQTNVQSYIQVIQPAPVDEELVKTKPKKHYHEEEAEENHEDSIVHQFRHNSKHYVTGFFGFANDFPKADNVQGNMAFGLGLGAELKNRFRLEGMLQYGSFSKNYQSQVDIDDFTGMAAFKVLFGNYEITPYAGALLSYSYRSYTNYTIDPFAVGIDTEDNTSYALDVGALGGFEFNVSQEFSVGMEFRYLWNMTSKSSGIYQQMYPNEKPLDTFSHYNLGLTGRYFF